MNVGFYLTKKDTNGYIYADYLMDSVRKHLPGVGVHQFTDIKSPSLWGVDAVHRLPPEPLCLARAAHYGSVEGDWLFLDTDCVVQSPMVAEVFNQNFNIAVTDRQTPVDGMPYCTGVLFSRSSAFWEKMYDMESKMSTKDQGWYAEQKAMAKMTPDVVLPGVIFQHVPEDDSIPNAAIVHYKGERKKHLMTRIQRDLGLVVR